MSTPEISPRAFFSLRTDVKQNAHYISDFQILYPAGSVLILHNYYEKRQRFIKLFERSIYLEMIAVSPSRKIAAIIENGDKGQILVFDMQTLKRRKTLNLPPDITTTRFETISFSYDDTYIIAITGDPDWNMVTYKWEKGKVTSVTKIIFTCPSTCNIQVCCSPVSNTEAYLYGQGLLKLLTMTETVWRQYGFQKADQINVTSVCWLTGERILCGTGDGKLFLVENGDFRGVYNALTFTSLTLNEKDDNATLTSSSLLLLKTVFDGMESEDVAVRALISFSKGFAYSCKTGCVHVFEKESNNKYRKRNLFRISDTDLGELKQVNLNIVKHLSINTSQDQLLATTNRAQLYSVRLWGPDIDVAPEIPFRHLGEPLHHGGIMGLTTCIWKPIFATFGEIDRTVRLWNYETESVEIVKDYSRDILSIDLHPTGNFLAVGFADALEISSVLLNDIQPFRSLPFVECHNCQFSYQGNYIAAVSEESIEVYKFVLLEPFCTLQGHIGKINALCWTLDNKKLGSCGSDGAIYVWDVLSGSLLTEIQTPDVCYWDIALSFEGKFIYAVGSDGLLKEITDNSIIRSLKMDQSGLYNISLSRSNLMMFLTGDFDAVLSVKMPLTDPPEFSTFFYHSMKINQLKLSFDDQTLISVSQGGTVIIWKLQFAEGKTVTMDKNFIYSTEILINKTELEKKIQTIKNLSRKLYELEMDQARELRDTENDYCENIKDIHETFILAIEELKDKVGQTEADQDQQLIGIKKEIEDLKASQEKEKKDTVENYSKKLFAEYEKVRALDLLKETTISEFEAKIIESEKSKEEETDRITKMYENKLEDVKNMLKKAYEENAKNVSEHDTEKQQLENDADREIVETKAKYEEILREEKELNVSLKQETVNMKKKHTEAQKDRDVFRAKAEVLRGEQQKYRIMIQELKKDVSDLKAEIVDRDTAIVEKDERIFLLKKKIQELEKFQFVLDYKIKELRKQIDPKDREIREKNEQMIDMEAELENLKKLNSSLKLQLVEVKEKIHGTEKEVNKYEMKHRSGVSAVKQVQVDIYELYQELNDFKKLKDGIKGLYHKYYQDDTHWTERSGESDAQRELLLQRKSLEKTIKALKVTLKKKEKNKKDASKVLQDNVVLLEELNQIRKDLISAVTTLQSLESLICRKDKKALVPSEAFNRFQQNLEKQENIRQTYQAVINEAEEETNEVNAKVKRMQEKLCALMLNDPKTY